LPSDRRVLECLLTGIREAHKHGFWLLLRTEGFKPVGVMTAKKFEMDPSKGVTRLWAVGVGLDGKVFKEPLDRFNPATQSFEPVLFAENDYGIAVTCRRRPEGDDEDNFLYFDNPYDAAEVRKMASDLAAKDRTIASMNRKLEEMRGLRDFWQQQADAFGEEARNLRDQVARLSREVAHLRGQVELYKRAAFSAEAFAVEAEAILRKVLEEAQEKGEFIGAEGVEKGILAARKMKELMEELQGMAGTVPGKVEEEIRKVSRAVEEIRSEKRKPEKPAEAEV